MELRAFDATDYQTLIDWIDSDKLNYLWGGPSFKFPLDHAQLNKHCSMPNVHPFMFEVDKQRAGYAELYRVSDTQLRVCRVFVSLSFRGRGLATLMLQSLIEFAQDNFDAHELSLAVFEHNSIARHCYESLGFTVISQEQGTRSFEGENWNLLRMCKCL